MSLPGVLLLKDDEAIWKKGTRLPHLLPAKARQVGRFAMTGDA
ncbi:hypothetical protein ACFLWS_02120 [Chloroflexota bacterium]